MKRESINDFDEMVLANGNIRHDVQRRSKEFKNKHIKQSFTQHSLVCLWQAALEKAPCLSRRPGAL